VGETIFSKIIRKEIPSDIVYETDNILAFKDINPKAPVHILIIPKISDMETIQDFKPKEHAEVLTEMFHAANIIAENEGISKDGFRLVINAGANGGQEVYHLHLHLLGGRKMNWPPG